MMEIKLTVDFCNEIDEWKGDVFVYKNGEQHFQIGDVKSLTLQGAVELCCDEITDYSNNLKGIHMKRFEANFEKTKSLTGKDIVEMEIIENFDEECSSVLCRTVGHATQHKIDAMGVCINALNKWIPSE